jgi:hypothetical protein
VPRAERSLAERIEQALASLAPERASVAALSRRLGISRNALYRFYPEAVRSIRRLREQARSSDAQAPTIKRLRAELARSNTLAHQLTALLDHYARAYQEAQELIARRDRELAELRRSRGSSPTPLRRTALT